MYVNIPEEGHRPKRCIHTAVYNTVLRRAMQQPPFMSVRLSVCLSTTILGLQATRRLMSDTNIFSVTRA